MSEGNSPKDSWLALLELVASGALLLVMIALGWMILVAHLPDSGRVFSVEIEIVVMLVLLAAALGLVSVVALVQTR